MHRRQVLFYKKMMPRKNVRLIIICAYYFSNPRTVLVSLINNSAGWSKARDLRGCRFGVSLQAVIFQQVDQRKTTRQLGRSIGSVFGVLHIKLSNSPYYGSYSLEDRSFIIAAFFAVERDTIKLMMGRGWYAAGRFNKGLK